VTADRALFERLARPRFVGTPAHAAVRETLKAGLGARGFRVLEHPFAATVLRVLWLPSLALAATFGWIVREVAMDTVRLRGLPLFATGAVAALALFGFAMLRLARRPPIPAVNLIAVRPGPRVKVWLVAHYDSKGQGISMAGRIVGVAVFVAGWVTLAGLGVAALAGSAGGFWTSVAAGACAFCGGLWLWRANLTDHSPGAVDNATGLLAVFSTVAALPPDAPVGVIFTDAEELGLEGARALARDRANLFQGTAVVNFDGLDDRGRPFVLPHRAGPLGRATAQMLGVGHSRVPVVVDGIALASVASECFTVMRGNWGTARVVHTPRDTAARLSLEGVTAVAGAVATAVARAVDAPPGPP